MSVASGALATRNEEDAQSDMTELRNLPSVEHLLNHPDLSDSISIFGRPLTRDGIRFALEKIRKDHQVGDKIPGQGEIIDSINASLSGLLPNTMYHFRVTGQNASGTDYGADLTFTTGGTAPTVTTMTPDGISTTGASLNGRVNASGAESVTRQD